MFLLAQDAGQRLAEGWPQVGGWPKKGAPREVPPGAPPGQRLAEGWPQAGGWPKKGAPREVPRGAPRGAPGAPTGRPADGF